MAKDKLEQFLIGLGAAVQLLNRAGKNGFFVEYVCLATSVVDALLRMGLILQYQLKNRTDDIPDEYLFQSEEDKIIPEREIYRRALKEEIIEQDLFNQLENLYRKRNKIIHRYIISDIKTDQVLKVGIQYELIIPIISNRIKVLEDKQAESNIGMTKKGFKNIEEQLMSEFLEMIPEKHGNTIMDYALKKKK